MKSTTQSTRHTNDDNGINYHFIHLGNLITIRAENRIKANFIYNKLIRGEHKHVLHLY